MTNGDNPRSSTFFCMFTDSCFLKNKQVCERIQMPGERSKRNFFKEKRECTYE